MAALMPLCINGKPAEARVVSVENHTHVDENGNATTHEHTHPSESCKIACEKCDLCNQAVLNTPALKLPTLPLQTQLTPNLVTERPQHIPLPPFRPPLA
ncbi:hypothetical protein [Chitinivorax sp. B]|uniref:hypothetical protein n=1 Tax=Chitinivorax sp. B TaxID=2502235 RepID=UPI0010F4ADA0|nr:hypothetical protein [Chitinivorax sp. B]